MYIIAGLTFILLAGLFLLILALYLARQAMPKKNVAVLPLFKNFSQKMYTTWGIGFFCLALYFLGVWVLAEWIKTQGRLDFFFFLLNHRVEFIYLGLATFGAISLFIHYLRLAVKSRYNSKRRD